MEGNKVPQVTVGPILKPIDGSRVLPKTYNSRSAESASQSCKKPPAVPERACSSTYLQMQGSQLMYLSVRGQGRDVRQEKG